MGLAVGVEKLAGAGLLAGGNRKSDDDTWTPHGRYGSVAALDGRIGTETMPGVFAQVGMEYGHKYGGASFDLFARISEKNHAHSTLNPLAAYTKKMSLDEIKNDIMIAYPNTRPMCSANCDGESTRVERISCGSWRTVLVIGWPSSTTAGAITPPSRPWRPHQACDSRAWRRG